MRIGEHDCEDKQFNYDLKGCYCGSAGILGCLAPKAADGACRDLMNAAAGSDDPVEVLKKFLDLGQLHDPTTHNALGVAMRLLTCDQDYCGTPCHGYNNCRKLDSTGAVIQEYGGCHCETRECISEGKCVPLEACIGLEECQEPDGGVAPPTFPAIDPATCAPFDQPPLLPLSMRGPVWTAATALRRPQPAAPAIHRPRHFRDCDTEGAGSRY